MSLYLSELIAETDVSRVSFLSGINPSAAHFAASGEPNRDVFFKQELGLRWTILSRSQSLGMGINTVDRYWEKRILLI